MKNIFERGSFDSYKVESLLEARGSVEIRHSQFAQNKIAVFISHKHDDLEELKGIIGFLEKQYKVKCYIDSKDPTLPRKTSGETANRIKQRIDECNKFILLATDGAVESKWCNWELGYGDAGKTIKNVAIFPIKEKTSSDNEYKGNEYMEIYSCISYYKAGEKYKNGAPIIPGYYIQKRKPEGGYIIEPLEEWLKG